MGNRCPGFPHEEIDDGPPAAVGCHRLIQRDLGLLADREGALAPQQQSDGRALLCGDLIAEKDIVSKVQRLRPGEARPAHRGLPLDGGHDPDILIGWGLLCGGERWKQETSYDKTGLA
jgi:hypothetical protein